MVRLITKPRVILVGLSIAAALIILQGCPFTPPTNGNHDGEKTQASPVAVLEKIENAFNTQNIEDYKDCLSKNFTFYFDPKDVGTDVEGYTIPESWSYYDETETVANMFSLAYSITLDITTTEVGDPDPDEDTYQADGVYIDLLLMVDSLNGYEAKGFVDFGFEVNGVDAEGNKIWVVKEWRDHTAV